MNSSPSRTKTQTQSNDLAPSKGSKGSNIYFRLLPSLTKRGRQAHTEFGGKTGYKLVLALLMWGNMRHEDHPEGVLEASALELGGLIGVQKWAVLNNWKPALEAAGYLKTTHRPGTKSLWHLNIGKLSAFLGIKTPRRVEAPKTVRYPKKEAETPPNPEPQAVQEPKPDPFIKEAPRDMASKPLGSKKQAFHAALDEFFDKCKTGCLDGSPSTEKMFLRDIRKVNVDGTLLIDWLRQDEKGQNSARFLMGKLWTSNDVDIEKMLTKALDKDYDPAAKRKEKRRGPPQRVSREKHLAARMRGRRRNSETSMKEPQASAGEDERRDGSHLRRQQAYKRGRGARFEQDFRTSSSVEAADHCNSLR